MKLVTKRIEVEVAYFVGRQDVSRGRYEGGVPDPEHLEEFRLDAAPDLVYSEETDNLIPSGMLQIHLHGSSAAYLDFARYLLALCQLETEDPDYHDHFEIQDSSGRPKVHLIVHAPGTKK